MGVRSSPYGYGLIAISWIKFYGPTTSRFLADQFHWDRQSTNAILRWQYSQGRLARFRCYKKIFYCLPNQLTKEQALAKDATYRRGSTNSYRLSREERGEERV